MDDYINRLAVSFKDVLVHLYLDYKSLGEFSWDMIERSGLPRYHIENNETIIFDKSSYKKNIRKIIEELRFDPYNVNIQSVYYDGKEYFTIVNIDDVIEKYYRRLKMTPPVPMTRKEFEEAWVPSGKDENKIKGRWG